MSDTTQPTTINFKSDFDFILTLKTCDGKDVGWPEYDWEAVVYTTSSEKGYKASCLGGVCVNCYNDEGRIHIVCDNHNLQSGDLKVEFSAYLPKDIYPDGDQKIVVPSPLGIKLVRGNCACPCDAEAAAQLPYIKGDKGDAFTFEDFTEEQIEEFKRPAVDAADKAAIFLSDAQKTLDDVNDGYAQLTKDAEGWAEAEMARSHNEAERIEAEGVRKTEFESLSQKSREATTKAEAAASAADTIARKLSLRSGKINVTVNFGLRQTAAQEMNFEAMPLSLASVKAQNIASLFLTCGDIHQKDILADAAGVAIPPGEVITLEAVRTTDGAPAYAFIQYEVKDN